MKELFQTEITMQTTNALHMTVPRDLNQFSVNLNNNDIGVNYPILLLFFFQKGHAITVSSNDKFDIKHLWSN